VVLLIENSIQRAKLSQQIHIGGGECIRWTVRHLVDATKADISRLTKILAEPIILKHPDFITFLETKKDYNIPDIIGYNYLSHYLTRFPRFSIHTYSIFKEDIIRHLSSIQQLTQELTDDLVEKGKELQERKNPKSPEQFSPISRSNRSFDSDQEFGPGSSFSGRTPSSSGRIPSSSTTLSSSGKTPSSSGRTPSSSGRIPSSSTTPSSSGLSSSIRRLSSQPRNRRQTGDKVGNKIHAPTPFGLLRVDPQPSNANASDNEQVIDSPDFEPLANVNIKHASHNKAVIDEPLAYPVDDHLLENAIDDALDQPGPHQDDSDSDIQILDDDIVRAAVDNKTAEDVDNDEIQIIEDECQIIEPEKSKEQWLKRRRSWKTGDKELDRKRYMEHLWWGPREERPPTILTEPYEAVTDLFFDPDHPIFCDRNLAVKYYKKELIEEYERIHKKK